MQLFPLPLYCVDGTNLPAGTLSTKTTFVLTPGSYYRLSFDLAGPWGGTLTDSVIVSLGDAFSETFTLTQRDPWQTFVRVFEVSSPTAGKLTFEDTGGDQNGDYLDNIKLESTPIPAPSTLVGLASTGLMAALGYGRRRRRRAA